MSNIIFLLGKAGEGDVTSLNDLTDVVITALVGNQILKYNSATGKWENKDGIEFSVLLGTPDDNVSLAAALNEKASHTEVTASMLSHVADDDPHEQYLLELDAVDAYAPISHDHVSDTWFNNALSGKESTGVAAGLIVDHEADTDPHVQYHNDDRGDARYSQLGHNHPPFNLDDPSVPALVDNTNNNSSIDRHGFLPKLDGDSSHVLRGDGTFGVSPAAGSTTSVFTKTPYAYIGPQSGFANGDMAITASTDLIKVTTGATQFLARMDLANVDTLDLQCSIIGGVAGANIVPIFNPGSGWKFANGETVGTTAPTTVATSGNVSGSAAGRIRGQVTLHSSLKVDDVTVSYACWGDGTNTGTLSIRAFALSPPITGIKGDTGDKGDKGDKGDPGSGGIVTSVNSVDFVVASGALSLKRTEKVLTVTSSQTVGDNEDMVICAASGPITITLTSTVGVKLISVINVGTGTVTVQGSGTQAVKGGSVTIAPRTTLGTSNGLSFWRATDNGWYVA